MKNSVWLAALGLVGLIGVSTPAHAQTPTPTAAPCAGDCDGNGMVVINELIKCVNIDLGSAALSTCMACDVDGNGTVGINELVKAVNAALNGCTPTTGAICGNGHMEPGEECDDGNTFGGDGCAANCTTETMRQGTFDPNLTISSVQTETGLIGPLHLTGSEIFRTGKARPDDAIGPNGQVLVKAGYIPVIIRADELKFDPVPVLGVVCACVRGIPVPDLFGAGVAAVGVIGCNADGLTDVSYRLIQDHVTNPGDPNNQHSSPPDGSPNDPQCNAVQDLPGGLMSTACKEQVDADCLDAMMHPHKGVCNGPRTITQFGGTAGQGSAFILNNTAIGQLLDTGVCKETRNADGSCKYASYGPDCQPCTDDDLDKGQANNLPTTTGDTDAAIFDTNDDGGVIADGQMCGSSPCQTKASGKNFDCTALENNPTGGLSGGSLAVAYPQLDAALVGDEVVSTVFFNK